MAKNKNSSSFSTRFVDGHAPSSTCSKTVEIYYVGAGGGHISATNAISDIVAEQYPNWTVRTYNIQKILEDLDPIHNVTENVADKLTTIREALDRLSPRLSPGMQRVAENFAEKLTIKTLHTEDIYNKSLKSETQQRMDYVLPILQAFIALKSNGIEDVLRQHWQNPGHPKPDLVISVIPNFNGVMFRALKSVHPAVPYVTIPTDMADIATHFWIERQDQTILCGTEKLYQRALDLGFTAGQSAIRVSGMILRKNFYMPAASPDLTREKLGLSPGKITAMIMFGGYGSGVAEEIVRQLRVSHPDLQTMVMCGNNKKLVADLRDIPGCAPVGFVNNVADYMRLSDFMIGKPGPGSISEAAHMGLPVLLESNAYTMPQERPNVRFVVDRGIGFAVKDFRKHSAEGVAQMLLNLDRFKANIRKLPYNDAIYEIAEHLGNIMEHGPSAVQEFAAAPSRVKRLRQFINAPRARKVS